MEKKQLSVFVTAAAVAAVLIGGGITVALASGGDAPAGTVQLPTVSSTAPPSSSVNSAVPTTAPPSTSTPDVQVVPLVPQQPAAQDNHGMTEPQPEPTTTMPTAPENGAPLNPPAPPPAAPSVGNPNGAPNPDPAPTTAP